MESVEPGALDGATSSPAPLVKKPKRSVLNYGPPEFPGWGVLDEYLSRAQTLDQTLETNQHELYLIVGFETGGRESEFNQVRTDQFFINDEAILVNNMVVLKQGRPVVRQFTIKRDSVIDPWADRLVELVEEARENKLKYLLPARKRFTGEIIPDQHISRGTVWNVITRIHGDLFPHLLRDLRGFHLTAPPESRGYGVDVFTVKEWFKWKKLDTADHYLGRVHLRQIADKMGINTIPGYVDKVKSESPA